MIVALLQTTQLVSPYVLSFADVVTVGLALSLFVYFDRRISKLEDEQTDFKTFYERAHAELRVQMAKVEVRLEDVLNILKENREREKDGHETKSG